MKGKPSYVAAAFNARPFGMPIPPNWFGLAAFGLLGALVNPAFLLIGAGVEGLYLWALSRNPRFRAVVDATTGSGVEWGDRYDALLARLDDAARRTQDRVEKQAAELSEILTRAGAAAAQLADVRQLTWLHLRLLAARSGFDQIIATAGREDRELVDQERRLESRLSRDETDDELRRSLEQQLAVIRSRRATHADAERRRELVDAELDRLRHQLALVREQALLAADDAGVASSLDALSASLNEANRWLKDQRELFAGLDDLTDEAPPPDILRPKSRRAALERGESA